jgi:DnaJ-domain-containing protein 1
VIRVLVLLLVAVLVVRAARRLLGAAHLRPRPAAEGPWDPHAVLGVGRNASREEITRRYHEELKRYHPDRVADLGVELQRLAHQKTIELRRAYDELVR